MRKLIIPILIVIAMAVGGTAWYYFSQIRHPRIEMILNNPRAYEGKAVTIDGEVTERTSFFVVAKFYKLRDNTGEIIVVTKRILPEVRSKVSVRGRIDEAFPIGDQKLLVFVEGSVNEKGRNKE